MRSKKLKLALAIVVILVFISAPFIYQLISVLYFTDYNIRKNFDSVQLGASKEEVIANEKLGTYITLCLYGVLHPRSKRHS